MKNWKVKSETGMEEWINCKMYRTSFVIIRQQSSMVIYVIYHSNKLQFCIAVLKPRKCSRIVICPQWARRKQERFCPNKPGLIVDTLWDVFTCISHRGIVLSVVCHFRQLRQRRVASMKSKIWYSDWLNKASKQDSVLHGRDLSFCWV